jgi:signal transduction histidine kinase
MGNPQNELALEGVMFFGKVSASISHEIKNVLAVMSESAGLIEDLCLLSVKRGVGLDVQRVQSLSGRIRNQVGRADEIVKNMNRFAHTVDEVVSTIDLQEHIQLLITLSRRLAAMREVSIEFVPMERQISLTTSPFLLLCLLWSCLHYSMSVCGAEKKVDIRVKESDAAVRISFSGLKDLSGSAGSGLPGDLERISARELRARVFSNPEAGAVTVELPWKISNDPAS